MHYFSNLFWYRTLHVSDRFAVHHQEPSSVYKAIGISHTGYADCLLVTSEWNILNSCRVLYQNKFEKQCILLVFIIKI